MGLVVTPKNCDPSVKKAIQQLSKKLEHVNFYLFDASRLLATDSNQEFSSVDDLTAWIAGTSNQVTVTDDADGTVTLSAPQDIHTDAEPEFAGWVIKDSSDNVVAFMDNSEFYITLYSPVEIVTGNPIGLLLALTYQL